MLQILRFERVLVSKRKVLPKGTTLEAYADANEILQNFCPLIQGELSQMQVIVRVTTRFGFVLAADQELLTQNDGHFRGDVQRRRPADEALHVHVGVQTLRHVVGVKTPRHVGVGRRLHVGDGSRLPLGVKTLLHVAMTTITRCCVGHCSWIAVTVCKLDSCHTVCKITKFKCVYMCDNTNQASESFRIHLFAESDKAESHFPCQLPPPTTHTHSRPTRAPVHLAGPHLLLLFELREELCPPPFCAPHNFECLPVGQSPAETLVARSLEDARTPTHNSIHAEELCRQLLYVKQLEYSPDLFAKCSSCQTECTCIEVTNLCAIDVKAKIMH